MSLRERPRPDSVDARSIRVPGEATGPPRSHTPVGAPLPGGESERLPPVRSGHRPPPPRGAGHGRDGAAHGVALGAVPGVARDPARAVRDGAARARGDPRRAVPGELPRLARALPQPRLLRRLPPRARVLRALPGAQGGALERVAGGRELRGGDGLGGAAHRRPGKGRACWLAIGYVLAEERAAYIAFQDADVVNFSRAMLARLVLPAVEPTVDFDFVKAYYARVSDRLHGRVTRLLLTPLLAAFTRLIGQDPYIRYLSSFRYALSGEFAVKSRPRVAHAPALRLGARDRHALRGPAPPRRRPHLPGGDRRALRPQAPGALRGRPRARPEPDGARRGEAPAADPRRRGREPRPGRPDEPARRLPAGGRGRGRRQLRGGEHQRPRLRPARGGAHRPCLHPGAAGRDRGVPGDPLGPPLVPNWSRVWAGVPDAGARLLAAVAKGDASVRRAWR